MPTPRPVPIDSLLMSDNLPPNLSSDMHNSLTLHSQPINEPWVFFTYFATFLLFIVVIKLSGGVLFRNIRYFLSPNKQQTQSFVNESIKSFWVKIFIPIFTTAVLTMAVYLLLYDPLRPFVLLEYAYLFGITTLFLLGKRLIFELIGYVFFEREMTTHYQRIYFHLLFLFAIVLLPVLILYTYQTGSCSYLLTVSLGLFSLYYIILIIKLFQMFFYKSIAYLYIILYLCTLEIIPLFVLFRVYENIL